MIIVIHCIALGITHYVRFSARQHICIARYMLYCPSVRLSGCLSHGWISRKRLKLGL